MGVKEGLTILKCSKNRTHHLKDLRKNHPPYPNPFVGVDISIWINKALSHKSAIDHFFMEPQVPVTHIIEYVEERLLLLRRYGFEPVFVFDGKRNPAKEVTTSNRYNNIPEL